MMIKDAKRAKTRAILTTTSSLLVIESGDDWIVSRHVRQLCKELRGQSLGTFIIYIIITRKIMKISWN